MDVPIRLDGLLAWARRQRLSGLYLLLIPIGDAFGTCQLFSVC